MTTQTTAIEKMAGDIGFDLAWAKDTVQADLLNGLAKGFALFGSDSGMQMSYVARNLTPQARKWLHEMAAFADLEEAG